jgi:hypothetical protein
VSRSLCKPEVQEAPSSWGVRGVTSSKSQIRNPNRGAQGVEVEIEQTCWLRKSTWGVQRGAKPLCVSSYPPRLGVDQRVVRQPWTLTTPGQVADLTPTTTKHASVGERLDFRPGGNDGSAAGFASLYLSYNGYQAGSKSAFAQVDMGRAEGHSPSESFFLSPKTEGSKGVDQGQRDDAAARCRGFGGVPQLFNIRPRVGIKGVEDEQIAAPTLDQAVEWLAMTGLGRARGDSPSALWFDPPLLGEQRGLKQDHGLHTRR